MDVFRIKDTLNTSWHCVASSSKDSLYIEFVVRNDAGYILRIQPELLCNIKCRVSIEVESSLLFPVIGKERSSIQSFFGDPRDGGKRKHHGVDIFAARNTEIIASADGYVGRTDNKGLGGRFIWVFYPSVSVHCYYAHLEKIIAVTGDKLRAGDIIGTIGNSGNAKYTPPHLHFGIYKNGYGAIDPYYFIATECEKSHKVNEELILLGNMARTNNKKTLLVTHSDKILLPINTSLKISALNTYNIKVRLPNGVKGFISKENFEIQDKPLTAGKIKTGARIYNSPSEDAISFKEFSKQADLNILSIFNEFFYIELTNGTKGWVKQSEII